MKNSSTSSSDTARPADGDTFQPAGSRWIASLVLALVCTMVALIAYESSLRASGAQPNFRDNQARWSSVRDKADRDTATDSIALLGASRIRAAISLNTLEARYPGQSVYSLAYAGRNPCAVLIDLAETTEFRGVVLMSMNSNWVDCRPGPFQMHRTVARYHQEWNWARKIDSWVSERVTQNLLFTDEHYSIRHLIATVLKTGHPLPETPHTITRKNRQIEFDFSRFNEDELALVRSRSRHAFNSRAELGGSKNPDLWEAGLVKLSEAIETITARGGRVVLLRLPTSDPLKLAEETHFPREQYWEELSVRLPATAILHYADYPALTQYDIPDGNHLDYRDAPDFTADILEAIEEAGLELKRR